MRALLIIVIALLCVVVLQLQWIIEDLQQQDLNAPEVHQHFGSHYHYPNAHIVMPERMAIFEPKGDPNDSNRLE